MRGIGRGIRNAAGAVWRNRGRIAKGIGAAALGAGAYIGAKKLSARRRGYSVGRDGTVNMGSSSYRRSTAKNKEIR